MPLSCARSVRRSAPSSERTSSAAASRRAADSAGTPSRTTCQSESPCLGPLWHELSRPDVRLRHRVRGRPQRLVLVSELPGSGRRYECPPDPRCAGKPVETSVFSPCASPHSTRRSLPLPRARDSSCSAPGLDSSTFGRLRAPDGPPGERGRTLFSSRNVVCLRTSDR